MNKFFDFLKLHGVFIAYFRNCKIQKDRSPREQVKWWELDTASQLINQAFTWDKTREGHYFWHAIHIDWARFCKLNEIRRIEDLKYPEKS